MQRDYDACSRIMWSVLTVLYLTTLWFPTSYGRGNKVRVTTTLFAAAAQFSAVEPCIARRIARLGQYHGNRNILYNSFLAGGPNYDDRQVDWLVCSTQCVCRHANRSRGQIQTTDVAYVTC